MKIIIQAGGFGTRLEGLTKNKPKCLVAIKNLPLIFHIFRRFEGADFIIIADYKFKVLQKYLEIFAKDVKYTLIKAQKKGTSSGLGEALEKVGEKEAFTLMWCDLLPNEGFKLPDGITQNYLGISKDFECRWSFKDDKFIKIPSCEDGVAGFFIFKDKTQLKNLPQEGAFVPYLQKMNLAFKRLNLHGFKEIGTLLSYADNNEFNICRPFNKVDFLGDEVIKTAITKQGEEIAKDELAWYEFVQDKFEFIPEIKSFKPLIMKRVKGKNIYEYDFLTHSQKKDILRAIIKALKKLHALVPARPAIREDLYENYIAKTYARLESVQELIPFAKDEFIKINNEWFKNVFFAREEIEGLFSELTCEHFVPIHGDTTFSNIMFDTFDMRAVLIDPRGYFGKSKIYGDADYDYAKLYYSVVGNYDQFNMKKFTLLIGEKEVELAIKSNGYEGLEELFFEECGANHRKIRILHALIWLSLTTYAWEDYDSICAAFYKGLTQFKGIL